MLIYVQICVTVFLWLQVCSFEWNKTLGLRKKAMDNVGDDYTPGT